MAPFIFSCITTFILKKSHSFPQLRENNDSGKEDPEIVKFPSKHFTIQLAMH